MPRGILVTFIATIIAAVPTALILYFLFRAAGKHDAKLREKDNETTKED